MRELNFSNIYSNIRARISKPKKQHIAIMFMQMEVMLDSGLDILACMKNIKTPSHSLQASLQDIVISLKNGLSLDKAFSKHRHIFGALTPMLLSAGLKSGNLILVLHQLHLYFDKSADTSSKLLKSLIYPLLVISAGIGAFLSIIYFVLPSFSALFMDFNVELPIFTRFLLGIATFLESFSSIIGMGCVLIIGGIVVLYKVSANFAFKCDSLALKLPLIGKHIALKESIIFSFCSFCMLKGGLRIDEVLRILENNSTNLALKNRYSKALIFIKNGKTLAQTLEQFTLLDSVSCALIEAGEKSGRVLECFQKVLIYLQKEQDARNEIALKMIEPIFSVVIGLMILVLALGVFLPMWEISTNIF